MCGGTGEVGAELLSREIVEVVLWVKPFCGVVFFAEVFHAFGRGVAVVVSGDVIGDEVDDHFESRLVSSVEERFELLHSVGDADGEVRVDVIVVLDGVGRACFSFDHGGMVFADSEGGVVRLCGVFDESCEPDVRESHA